MTRLRRVLRLIATLWLLVAASPSAADSAVLTDELLAPLTSAYMRAVQPGEPAELHRELLGTVLKRVQRSHAQEVDVTTLIALALQVIEPLDAHSGDPAEVFRKAVNAALASLDPHSRYLDPRAQNNLRSTFAGSFGGLGLQVELVEGLVRVVTPMPDTPAARAGLQTGDLIVRIDDQGVEGMALADAISKMRGAPGTSIVLLVRRPGHEEDFSISLVRETIRTQPVRWSMEGDVLVVRLASFTGAVVAMVEKAITEASDTAPPRGIVLDMRGNPGGLLRQAVMTADTFLREGDIVSLRGRTAGNRRTWQADETEHLAGVPMVVLIDGRSASAAELVAAALQDHGRATVMGQRSVGKGSVQSIVSLGDGKGALRLTTALYHGPSGRTVQRTGVGPDIELVTATATAQRRREADRAQALPGSDEPLPPKAKVEQERCAPAREDQDAALACALAFLKAGTMAPFLAGLASPEPSVSP
jgi:carboxyl-terminal processing protease